MIVMLAVIAVIAIIMMFGALFRRSIFEGAGEYGGRAFIPVIKCQTYGKIVHAEFLGWIEGICSVASKILIVKGILDSLAAGVALLFASILTALTFTYDRRLFDGIDAHAGDLMICIGVTLLVVQILCRCIIRHRFDKQFGIHPAMILLWFFLPHIAEIIVGNRSLHSA